MLNLVLVVGMCGAGGCDYIDVTSRFPEVTNDYECVLMAADLNLQNASQGEDPRFACLEPAKLRELNAKHEL